MEGTTAISIPIPTMNGFLGEEGLTMRMTGTVVDESIVAG